MAMGLMWLMWLWMAPQPKGPFSLIQSEKQLMRINILAPLQKKNHKPSKSLFVFGEFLQPLIIERCS